MPSRHRAVVRKRISLAILLAGAAACGEHRTPAAAGADERGTLGAAIQPPSSPYQVDSATAGGAIAGLLTFHGKPLPDSIIPVSGDSAVCGDSAIIPGQDSGTVAGALVWLDDIRRGKPLPSIRRFLTILTRCRVDPIVQGAVVGGMMNVYNDDDVAHHTRFQIAGADSTLDVVSESMSGQVVPTARPLARATRVLIGCDDHPWTRGWVQVFDQPYFSLSDDRGRFTLDSVPPGTYHLKAWHPRLGTSDQLVTVTPGKGTVVTMSF